MVVVLPEPLVVALMSTVPALPPFGLVMKNLAASSLSSSTCTTGEKPLLLTTSSHSSADGDIAGLVYRPVPGLDAGTVCVAACPRKGYEPLTADLSTSATLASSIGPLGSLTAMTQWVLATRSSYALTEMSSVIPRSQ